MSLPEVTNTKGRILDILIELEQTELETIEKWIRSRAYIDDLKKKKDLYNLEKPLRNIADSLKKIVKFEATMATENIIPPTVGDQADCTNINTRHVDEFLYDDSHVEKLIKKGKLKKYYCTDCLSNNIEEYIFISHSMSKNVLQYIFKVLLPQDLKDKQLLDVGSRLGVVLYGAYYYSNVSKIIGVEINEELCKVQESIVNQYSMDERIQVIHSDVTGKSDLIESSDVIVINVLDFFVDENKHREMWWFFKKHMKKGTYLISNRSMADTFDSLNIFEEYIDWLDVCKPFQCENEIFFDVEDYSEIYLYSIK